MDQVNQQARARPRRPLQQLPQSQAANKSIVSVKPNLSEDDLLKKSKKRAKKSRKETSLPVIPIPRQVTTFTEILRDNSRELRLKLELKRKSLCKIGQVHVDFVYELTCEKSIYHVMHMIFSNLRAKDLTAVACVSSHWNEAIRTDRRVNDRRLRHLKKMHRLKKNVGSENWPIKPKPNNTVTPNRLFRTIQNLINRT